MPYKYDLTKFVNVGSISVDHIDPSIFCVLTAKSRDLTAPLADFLTFSPRWDVASRVFIESLYLVLSLISAKTHTALHTITAMPPPN